MQQQSFNNYIRFYAPHHFVFYPVMTALLVATAYFAATTNDTLIWGFIGLGFLSIILLSFMLRQHYALTLQDRIVRLELRYRYFALTGKRFEHLEPGLRDSQVFALRFCPDEELEAMATRAYDEKMPGTKIKKAIVNWKADLDRV